MTPNPCSCGQRPKPRDRHCRKCGHPVNQSLVTSSQKNLTTFEPLRDFADIVKSQQEWLRENTLLEPVQAIIDAISLVSMMADASTRQVRSTLEGYEIYVDETIQQAIDRVRLARKQAEEELRIAVKRQELLLEDMLAERQHQRQLELQRQQHMHERRMIELQVTLELTTNLLTIENELKAIGLEAQVQRQADLARLKLFPEVIEQLFRVLSALDENFHDYAEKTRLKLETAELKDAPSFEQYQEVLNAIVDYLVTKVSEYGQQPQSD